MLAGSATTSGLDVRALVVGDGVADRIALDRPPVGPPALLLAVGDGYGGFGTATPVPDDQPGHEINDVVLADVDTDGDLDLLTAGSHGVRVPRNDGAGVFTGPFLTASGCGSPASGYFKRTGDGLDAVDVDADGDLDIVWTGSCAWTGGDGWELGTAFNDGTGGFSRTSDLTAASAGRRIGTETADVNEDGHLDRIVGDPDSAVAEVVLGRDPGAPGPLPPLTVLTVPTPGPGREPGDR